MELEGWRKNAMITKIILGSLILLPLMMLQSQAGTAPRLEKAIFAGG